MGTVDVDPDDRRKHPDFLQAAIARMAGASAVTTKGWLLPVVTAICGYALTKGVDSIAVLVVGAIVVFAVIDTDYLNQERAFRRLYEAAVRAVPQVPVFEMDPALVDPTAAAVECWGIPPRADASTTLIARVADLDLTVYSAAVRDAGHLGTGELRQSRSMIRGFEYRQAGPAVRGWRTQWRISRNGQGELVGSWLRSLQGTGAVPVC
ncbi:hypothetical protein ACWDSJ_36940 [Nocardia sp. NPDC003482]